MSEYDPGRSIGLDRGGARTAIRGPVGGIQEGTSAGGDSRERASALVGGEVRMAGSGSCYLERLVVVVLVLVVAPTSHGDDAPMWPPRNVAVRTRPSSWPWGEGASVRDSARPPRRGL